MSIVTGRQIRAARALIGWSRGQLATASGLHANSVGYWEGMTDIPTGASEPHACRCIREALKATDVEVFVNPAPGVRLCNTANFSAPEPARAHAPHGVQLVIRRDIDADLDAMLTNTRTRARSGPCGAATRRGTPCKRQALPSGRCPNHGGMSTGPKTAAGRERIAAAQRARWALWRQARASQELRP